MPVRVTRRVPFKKKKIRGRGRSDDEGMKDDGYVRVAVSPSLLLIQASYPVEGRGAHRWPSSYLHAPLISSSLSTVGGHSRFRAPCSVFRPIVEPMNVDRVFPLERDSLVHKQSS